MSLPRMREKLTRQTSKVAGVVFIDYRLATELVVVGAAVVAFIAATGDDAFDDTLDDKTRSTLYVALAGTTGALLGFVLTGLAILIALPASDRLEALRTHPKWPRVPSAYFRASRALLAALVLCTLGIALDSAKEPWSLWEAITTAVLVLALVRVAAALVALAQLLAIATAPPPADRRIQDPGP